MNPRPFVRQCAALSGSPFILGVICRRGQLLNDQGKAVGPALPLTNIARTFTHHSPDGFEWAYGGSGPAELALAILNTFVPPGSDWRDPVQLWAGEVSAFAWEHHQAFKREFIASMPKEGGNIPAQVIREWIRERYSVGDVCPSDAPEGGIDLASEPPAV